MGSQRTDVARHSKTITDGTFHDKRTSLGIETIAIIAEYVYYEHVTVWQAQNLEDYRIENITGFRTPATLGDCGFHYQQIAFRAVEDCPDTDGQGGVIRDVSEGQP